MVKFQLYLQSNQVESSQSIILDTEDCLELFETNSYGYLLLKKLLFEDPSFQFDSRIVIHNNVKKIYMVIQGIQDYPQNRWYCTTSRDLDMVLGVLEGQSKDISKQLDPVEQVKLILLCGMLGIKH